MRKIFITASLALVISLTAKSQITSSPYTIIGLGDWVDRSLSHMSAMGDIGIGTPSLWNVNSINPALLVANDLTVFEMAVQAENRGITNSNGSQKLSTAGYRYIEFAFPIKPGKWTSNISVKPRSVVNYQFSSNAAVQNTTFQSTSNSEGEGGLTEVNFANGFRLYKGLTLGIRGSYLFGFADHKNTSFLNGDFSNQFPLSYTERTTYRGFNYGLGLAYGQKIGGIDSDQSVGLGLIYEQAKPLKGERLVDFAAETTNGTRVIGDTINLRSVNSDFELPGKLGIGFSWIKLNQLTVGLDIVRSNWNNRAGFSNDGDRYRSTWDIGIGMEWIPDFDNIDKYLARIRYRLGIKFEQLPYIVNGQSINDIGINFGWSFPVRRASMLNMAFKYGLRGTQKNNLVEERYFRFTLGATINDRWFVRRRYN